MKTTFEEGKEEGRKEGMSEVVGFVIEHGHPSRDTWHWEIDRDDWQAFLDSICGNCHTKVHLKEKGIGESDGK